jgi:hypothetical protein
VNTITEWTFGLPWWGSLIVLAACLAIVAELGLRLGRGAVKTTPDRDGGGQIAVVLGGLLGLLGLLLSFSFGIVESRYAVRKTLVLEEANAIGTTYLRAGLLPDETSQRIRALLREYVDLRQNPTTPAALQVGIERSGQIHGELWRHAELVGKAHPGSEMVGQFIESLNAVIDLHTSRVSVSLHQRLPPAIFNVLFAVSLLALFILGYASGLGGRRELMAVVALGMSVAGVMVMIRPLAAPGTTTFRIDQGAMHDLRRMMSEN